MKYQKNIFNITDKKGFFFFCEKWVACYRFIHLEDELSYKMRQPDLNGGAKKKNHAYTLSTDTDSTRTHTSPIRTLHTEGFPEGKQIRERLTKKMKAQKKCSRVLLQKQRIHTN